MKYIVKTIHGLEAVLAEELRQLGAKEIELLTRAVSFEGGITVLYKANLHLRTALRILMPVHRFEAFDEHELYQAIYDFDWFPYLKVNQTFAIDATVSSQFFTHSKYVALKTKDAIADQFRKRLGKRPSVDTADPDLRINVHVFKNAFTISIDSSGDSLHKRGYRLRLHPAPINEVLAAGMVLLSEWTPDQVLADPMCGSGTILMEAAMFAKNIPPAPRNRRFGFQTWKNYDPLIWKDIVTESRDATRNPKLQIFGSDREQLALDITKESILKFNLERDIDLRNRDFRKSTPPAPEGVLITNPPYGERIGAADMNAFYEMIGDRLKQEWTGWDAWMISSNMEALKHIGLRPSKKTVLFNGPLECKFQKFSLYSGSKKEKKLDS
ncbi:MAG: class I SAM-dependent RNA methyltransferase [Saprospiraceae bacterium]|nr:class I SAM-dependent RNA methyltransferase [Saprospiraceae bacterium]